MSIIIAVISGGIGAIIGGIFGLINRHLDKKDAPINLKFQEIDKRMDKQEKDSVRLQMLVLISDYPTNNKEILEIAKHYFHDLKGDWYMTPIFNRWLEENNIGKPNWFNSEL